MSDFAGLTDRQRGALDALCRRIVPSAYAGEPERAALVDAIEARLGALERHAARRFGAVLTLFDHPVTALLATGVPRRFSRRSSGAQDAWLRRWERSRLPALRTVFQAVRRLILTTCYGMPAAQRAIGYRGPLHVRGPELPWEGALRGEPTDAEPVLRVPDGDRGLPSPPDGVRPAGVRVGREIRPGTSVRADVCVVGTGAGGGVAAARLAERGFDVVVLEEGGYWTASDFTEDEAESMRRLYADAGARATEDLSLSIFQGRCVGGGTTVNWMLMLRTPDRVLDEWAEVHGAEGFRASAMAPVFDRIEDEVHAREVPEDAHSPSNRLILDGARTLGWRARAARINAKGCVRAGFCGIGCRYGAKQSTAVTYLPRALAAGARLFADVRADRIASAERGGDGRPRKRVEATILERGSGRARGVMTVEAPIVVLAAGAVGTPVILQRSGLGGRAVGRYLRVHPTTAVVARYDREIYGAAGIPQSAVCDEFLDRAGGYGFWIECPSLLPALAAGGVPGFGEPHAEVMRDYRRLGSFIVLVRDGARGGSQGSVRLDRRGRTRIRYRLGRVERRTLADGIAAAARLHLAAGAAEALTLHSPRSRVGSLDELAKLARRPVGPNRVGLFTAHMNGTCRIGTDPETSACGPDGQLHGAAGVYVMDGSLLPTAPAVNPQETIMAVATVLAERLADRHG